MRSVPNMLVSLGLAAGLLTAAAAAETRVQSIARLQGEHVNRLMGYGLVVGLNGTGDGGKRIPTMRALMSLHQRYEQNVLSADELTSDENVAVVIVEAETPKDGWRSGERVDVIVSALGAESLAGGQLLVTPLQVSPLPQHPPAGMDRIWALAGGKIEIVDEESPTRAIIRGGAVMEADYYQSYILDQHLTLVINDASASFPLAQVVARAINQEVSNPAAGGIYERGKGGELVVQEDIAVALSPKEVRVRVPSYELAQPARFISQVLETPLFVLPKQPARVVINRTTNQVSLTGSVTILPTVVQIPGLGTVSVGEGGGNGGGGSDIVGVSTQPEQGIDFQQLLATLDRLKLPAAQTVQVIEQLHKTGTLQAQLIYTE